MASASIEINEDSVQLLFQKLLKAGAELEDPLREMGDYLLESHEDRFHLEIDSEGDDWEILSPLYEARKKKKKPAAGILVYDGLLEVLHYDASDEEVVISSQKNVNGVNVAAVHQFGSKDGLIPARPFLGFSEEDIDEAQVILGDHLERLLNGQ